MKNFMGVLSLWGLILSSLACSSAYDWSRPSPELDGGMPYRKSDEEIERINRNRALRMGLPDPNRAEELDNLEELQRTAELREKELKAMEKAHEDEARNREKRAKKSRLIDRKIRVLIGVLESLPESTKRMPLYRACVEMLGYVRDDIVAGEDIDVIDQKIDRIVKQLDQLPAR